MNPAAFPRKLLAVLFIVFSFEVTAQKNYKEEPVNERDVFIVYTEFGLPGSDELKVVVFGSHIYRYKYGYGYDYPALSGGIEAPLKNAFWDKMEEIKSNEFNPKANNYHNQVIAKGHVKYEFAYCHGPVAGGTGPELYITVNSATEFIKKVRERIISDYRQKGYIVLQTDFQEYFDDHLRQMNLEKIEKLSPLYVEEYHNGDIRNMARKFQEEDGNKTDLADYDEGPGKSELKEQDKRRKDDEKTISKNERMMKADPVMYKRQLDSAARYFNLANKIDPFAALNIDKAWWDNNHYMAEFRDDLNEPRRREAWQKSQRLLIDMEVYYEAAKYYYMEAVKYANRNSREHQYALDQVSRINDMIDFQKSMITASREIEDQRQINYEDAKVYKYLNRIRRNEQKAKQTYSILTQDYLYPNHNSKVQGSENAIERQRNFEQRLNNADAKLSMDNAITGVTTQLTMEVMLDDSKTAEVYGNHSMGFNAFMTSGFVFYPVVANMTAGPNTISEARTYTLGAAPFQVGFDWWINRSNNWDLAVGGDGMIGVLPILGYNNFLFTYGGNIKFNLGIKRVKLAFEADWHNRSGNFTYDHDVAMSDQDNPWQQPTEMIYTGEFNYSVLKAGAGLHISVADEYEDGYLRLMYFAEKPSFYQNYDFKKPVMSGMAQFVSKGGFTFSVEFAKNYPIAGTAKYMMRDYTDQDMVRFAFGKTWTLAKTH